MLIGFINDDYAQIENIRRHCTNPNVSRKRDLKCITIHIFYKVAILYRLHKEFEEYGMAVLKRISN